jgi:hypothetical protein
MHVRKGVLELMAVVAAAVVLLVGCEEMFEEGSGAPSATAERLRRQLGLSKTIEVVVTGKAAGGGDVYVLRNPEKAGAPSTSTRRLLAASNGTRSQVGFQFDTAERVARASSGAVEFSEVSAYPEVLESLNDARYWGDGAALFPESDLYIILSLGGVDVDAIQEWLDGMAELRDQIEDWIDESFADVKEGPRLPSAEVQVDWYHDKVLALVTGTVGEPIAAKTLPKSESGGYGELTYCLSDWCSFQVEDGARGPTGSAFGGGDPLPAGLVFDPDTRVVSGVPAPSTDFRSGRAVVQYVVFDELGRSASSRVAFEIAR